MLSCDDGVNSDKRITTMKYVMGYYDRPCEKMSLFRPCIDLHSGQVKQIVGGTLTVRPDELKTNFVSDKGSEYFAELYKKVCDGV